MNFLFTTLPLNYQRTYTKEFEYSKLFICGKKLFVNESFKLKDEYLPKKIQRKEK